MLRENYLDKIRRKRASKLSKITHLDTFEQLDQSFRHKLARKRWRGLVRLM
jgi:uncharacterized protein YnzC (UPF0291/DUF896 family)